jgi:hypothetical protein
MTVVAAGGTKVGEMMTAGVRPEAPTAVAATIAAMSAVGLARRIAVRRRYEPPPPQAYQQPRGRPNPYAQPGESWRGPSGGPTGGEISMSQAIRIVQGLAGPGHHLDGQREERGGRTYYRIQWATDRGERRDYYIDAQTGALIGR